MDEEISFTRRGTKTTDTFAFDIEEDNMENNDAEGNDTDGDEADEDDTDEDDREEDDTDEDNAEDYETEEDDAENDDSDDEEEISFPRRKATPAARSGTKAASGLRTHIKATVMRRGGFTELGMKGLLLQLLKDKEELLKSNQDLVREKEELAKEKEELVKKNQKRLKVDRTKKVEVNARVSVRSEDPAENVAIDDQQTDGSTIEDLGASVDDVEEEFDQEDGDDGESKDLVENYQQSGGIAGEDLGSSGEGEARDTDMGEGTRGTNLHRDEDKEAVDDVEEEFHHEELEGGGSVDVGKEHEDLGSRKCFFSFGS